LSTYIYEGGSGGYSGGGGASGTWKWGDADPSEYEYKYPCSTERAYLGYVYDIVDNLPESYSYKVLMRRRNEPSYNNYYTWGGPPRTLDFVLDYRGDMVYESAVDLPIPDECDSPAYLFSVSPLSPASTAFRLVEMTLDGSNYQCMLSCWPGVHSLVLYHRGQGYIDSLYPGYFPGIERVWEWEYQAVVINEFRGARIPLSGGMSGGAGASGFWGQSLRGASGVRRFRLRR
jgi:hypothetical protein